MKRIIALVLVLVIAFSLVACGAPGAAKEEENKKLVVWIEKIFNDRPTDKLIERIKAWGDANGVEIEVSLVGAVDFVPKLSAAIEGGGMPDIFTSYYARVLNFYPEMIAADVTDLYKEIDEKVGFRDSCEANVTIDGKVRVLPLQSSAVLMYCRADKLQAAGYTAPPTTWEEVFEMARAVSDPENGFFGLGIGCGPANDDDCYDLVLNYVHSNGDAMFDDEGNPTTNNEGLKKWFQMWKDLYAEEVIPTDALTWDSSGNNNTYLTGQSCFVFNAATLAYSLANDESMAELYENTWIAPMPAGDAGLITNGNWHGLSIAEASENKELAAELLKYIYDTDWLAEYSEHCRPLLSPSVESLAMSDMWQADPICKAVVDCASRGTGRWGYSSQTSTGLAIGAKLVYSFKMNEMCNGVASGTLSVDEALTEYQKTAEEIAATFK